MLSNTPSVHQFTTAGSWWKHRRKPTGHIPSDAVRMGSAAGPACLQVGTEFKISCWTRAHPPQCTCGMPLTATRNLRYCSVAMNFVSSVSLHLYTSVPAWLPAVYSLPDSGMPCAVWADGDEQAPPITGWLRTTGSALGRVIGSALYWQPFCWKLNGVGQLANPRQCRRNNGH